VAMVVMMAVDRVSRACGAIGSGARGSVQSPAPDGRQPASVAPGQTGRENPRRIPSLRRPGWRGAADAAGTCICPSSDKTVDWSAARCGLVSASSDETRQVMGFGLSIASSQGPSRQSRCHYHSRPSPLGVTVLENSRRTGSAGVRWGIAVEVVYSCTFHSCCVIVGQGDGCCVREASTGSRRDRPGTWSRFGGGRRLGRGHGEPGEKPIVGVRMVLGLTALGRSAPRRRGLCRASWQHCEEVPR
jgi:hypothetical protein